MIAIVLTGVRILVFFSVSKARAILFWVYRTGVMCIWYGMYRTLWDVAIHQRCLGIDVHHRLPGVLCLVDQTK